MRTLIVGWPGTGKTTLAKSMGGGMSTDDVMATGWADASDEVSTWLDHPGPWLIEGVAVPRALRKWRERNAHQPPPFDRMIRLTTVHRPLKPQAAIMGRGIDIVLNELRPWIADRMETI